MTQQANCFELNGLELASYAQDGYCIRRDLFNPTEVQQLLQAIESATQRARSLAPTGNTYHLDGKRFIDVGHLTLQYEHQADSDELRVIEPVYELDERLDQLADDPRLVHPMQQLIERDTLALWTAKLNLKPARTGSGFGWHQDSPYWVHASDDVDRLPNVYIALDDANERNGCLCAIRASHKRGCLPGTSDGGQLGGFFTDPKLFEQADRVALEMRAGTVVFFDPHLVHGSAANPTDQPRRALIYTYQPGGLPALKSGKTRNVVPLGATATARSSAGQGRPTKGPTRK